MIKYIVDSGLEDIDSSDSEGRTIVSIAAEMNQIEDCKLFIKLGADPTIEDKTGKNASDYATAKNNSEILELFERY